MARPTEHIKTHNKHLGLHMEGHQHSNYLDISDICFKYIYIVPYRRFLSKLVIFGQLFHVILDFQNFPLMTGVN